MNLATASKDRLAAAQGVCSLAKYIDDNSELNVSCTFDTRSVTKPVQPGFGTSNEMCLLGMYLVKVN